MGRGAFKANFDKKEICAIETLSDLGADVQRMWLDENSSTDVKAWHAACQKHKLDYRTDNQYIKILKKLNYQLVSNEETAYNTMNWGDFDDGDYFLSTISSGTIGYAYGVTIASVAVSEIHDRQKLHKGTDRIKYVFKKP